MTKQQIIVTGKIDTYDIYLLIDYFIYLVSSGGGMIRHFIVFCCIYENISLRCCTRERENRLPGPPAAVILIFSRPGTNLNHPGLREKIDRTFTLFVFLRGGGSIGQERRKLQKLKLQWYQLTGEYRDDKK